MTPLGILPEGAFSVATGINDKGQIVGYSDTATPGQQTRAFLYSGGKMTDLATLPGGTFSVAYSINDKGQIVGYSDTPSGPSQYRAFLYTPSSNSLPAILSLLLGD